MPRQEQDSSSLPPSWPGEDPATQRSSPAPRKPSATHQLSSQRKLGPKSPLAQADGWAPAFAGVTLSRRHCFAPSPGHSRESGNFCLTAPAVRFLPCAQHGGGGPAKPVEGAATSTECTWPPLSVAEPALGRYASRGRHLPRCAGEGTDPTPSISSPLRSPHTNLSTPLPAPLSSPHPACTDGPVRRTAWVGQVGVGAVPPRGSGLTPGCKSAWPDPRSEILPPARRMRLINHTSGRTRLAGSVFPFQPEARPMGALACA